MEFFDKDITVNVGEAVIPTFKALRIEQRIGTHHEFELVLDLETGGNRFAHDLASSSDWLGETLTVRVGREVKIDSSFYQALNTLSQKTLGEFIITEITHEVGEDGYYRNRFKAIPSMLETIPVPDVRFPNAETQMATVTRNDDPKGSGRIQVQMNWQSDGMHTDWIRVMTPDAGKSGDVKSNRGFVFIPEVGDQVLVGFRHGDPSRPYSLGSLFNGFTGKGGGPKNSIKSLKTRSGISVILNDDNRSLEIKDAGGSSIHLDGNGNILLNAPKNIQLWVDSTSKCKFRQSFHKSIAQVMQTSIFLLVSC